MNSKLLEVNNLSKKFNLVNKKNENFYALSKVNFSGSRGEIIGITGANGSGKTTLLRIIAGIYKYDEGVIINNSKIIRSILNTEAGLISERSGRYNLINYGMLIGISKSDIISNIDAIIEFSELSEFIDEPVRNYSTGMKARLTFSVFSAFKSDIFLLDETFSAGDVEFRKRAIARIKLNAKLNNSLILMISHNAQEIYDHCDNCLGLHKGRKVVLDNSKIFHDVYFKGSLNEKDISNEIVQKKYDLFRSYDFPFYVYNCKQSILNENFFFELNCIVNTEHINFKLQFEFTKDNTSYLKRLLNSTLVLINEVTIQFELNKSEIYSNSKLHIHVLNIQGEVIFSFFNLWNNLEK